MPAAQREAKVDWALAIRRNREALIRVIAALLALVGLTNGPHPEGPKDGQDPWLASKAEGEPRRTLPRSLHTYALRILRVAESAIRRLIVIAARDVVCQPRPAGGVRPNLAILREERANKADAPGRIPAFPLLDPLKRYTFDPVRRASKFMPRICVVGITEPAPIPQKPVISPDDLVDATGLASRLLSSRRALANLTREALRLARWYQRNKLRSRARRVSPLRIGHPPGKLKRPTHAVDDVLKECQALALDVLYRPDTS
jgi:hypothetical protein